MDSVPMPRDLSEEAVAAFMREVCCLNVQRIPAAELRAWEHSSGKEGWRIVAAHVLALLRAKVREAVEVALAMARERGTYAVYHDDVIARVLGEEAPRG